MIRKYEINENFFENIDTEEKAYWLGFIYADGCVTKDHKYLIIELSGVDINHLKLFQSSIQSNHQIKIKKNNIVRLSICNKKLVFDLIKLGCVPAKSLILQFPNEEQVPKHLLHHFIRGYFDGDGCLSITTRTKNNRKTFVYDWHVLGTHNMLNNILEFLNFKNISLKKNGKIFKLRAQSKKVVMCVLDILYFDSCVFLKRKYLKYQYLQQIT